MIGWYLVHCGSVVVEVDDVDGDVATVVEARRVMEADADEQGEGRDGLTVEWARRVKLSADAVQLKEVTSSCHVAAQ